MTRKEKIAAFDQGYNVAVTGRHVQVTQGMKNHAVDRISRLERLGSRIIDVDVTMDIQRIAHRVDISMKYGSTLIRSHAVTTDMYVSIDQAVDRLARNLKKYKQKLQDYHEKGYPEIEMPIRVVPSLDEVDEVNDAIEEEAIQVRSEFEQPPAVVSEGTQPLKILSEEEAVMKMNLSGTPVMVFRSEEDRCLKVIYRRGDGRYGIITPE